MTGKRLRSLFMSVYSYGHGWWVGPREVFGTRKFPFNLNVCYYIHIL